MVHQRWAGSTIRRARFQAEGIIGRSDAPSSRSTGTIMGAAGAAAAATALCSRRGRVIWHQFRGTPEIHTVPTSVPNEFPESRVSKDEKTFSD